MRGTAVRVLDNRYLEFLEALRDLGELGSLARLISGLAGAGEKSYSNADGGMETLALMPEIGRAIHAFWILGWIEVRETTRKSKYGQKKNYSLKVSLDKIADHFLQEKMHKYKSVMAAEAFQAHKAAVMA